MKPVLKFMRSNLGLVWFWANLSLFINDPATSTLAICMVVWYGIQLFFEDDMEEK